MEFMMEKEGQRRRLRLTAPQYLRHAGGLRDRGWVDVIEPPVTIPVFHPSLILFMAVQRVRQTVSYR